MPQKRKRPSNLPEIVLQRATPAPLVHTPPPHPGELQTRPADPAPLVNWVDAALSVPPPPDGAPPPPQMSVYYADHSEHHYHHPHPTTPTPQGDTVSFPLLMWVFGFLSATCLIGVLWAGSSDRRVAPQLPPPPPSFPQVQP